MFNLLASRTLQLAFMLLPLLGESVKLDKADDWVYGRLPDRWTQKGTLKEFEKMIKSGKEFISDVYNFVHN